MDVFVFLLLVGKHILVEGRMFLAGKDTETLVESRVFAISWRRV